MSKYLLVTEWLFKFEVFIINVTTYSSSLQVSGFSILYPFFSSRNNSLLSMVGYGVPPDMVIQKSVLRTACA